MVVYVPPENTLVYIKYGYNGWTLRDSEAQTQQFAHDALPKMSPTNAGAYGSPRSTVRPTFSKYVYGNTFGQISAN